MKYKRKVFSYGLSVVTATAAFIGGVGPLYAQEKKPNIVMLMTDDSWYSRAVMRPAFFSASTPKARSRVSLS